MPSRCGLPFLPEQTRSYAPRLLGYWFYHNLDDPFINGLPSQTFNRMVLLNTPDGSVIVLEDPRKRKEKRKGDKMEPEE